MNELETVIRRIVREEIEAVLANGPETSTKLIEPLDPRAMLSIARVAELLEVGRHYVQNRIDAGELQTVELGSSVKPKQRISVAALDEFIRGRTFPR